ncbi:MAG TPA: PIN domain-containing protein [Verrucomicrobiae bacterium]
MAATKVLLDTGPLIAYLNSRDAHHDWAAAAWASIYEPLSTCESVLSEAIFCLESVGIGAEPILQLMERGLIGAEFSFEQNRADIFRLLRKYSDQPMSLADACLVRMAELAPSCQVFTTDRDFLVYRRSGRQVIPLLAPFQG